MTLDTALSMINLFFNMLIVALIIQGAQAKNLKKGNQADDKVLQPERTGESKQISQSQQE